MVFLFENVSLFYNVIRIFFFIVFMFYLLWDKRIFFDFYLFGLDMIKVGKNDCRVR